MADVFFKLPEAPLRAVAPHLSDREVALWATALTVPMRSSGIITPYRVAAFLGQVAHESDGFRVLEENLHYSRARLCQVWPSRFQSPEAAEDCADNPEAPDAAACAASPEALAAAACANNPEALANTVYAGRLGNEEPGDGWLFHGRGLIQLTGRYNYKRLAAAVKMDLAAVPAWLTTPAGAAVSACWFWSDKGLNAPADVWHITAMTKIINGGTVGLAERLALCNAARAALGAS